MPSEFVEGLKGMIAKTEKYDELSNMLDHVRTAYENPKTTLERLIRERAGIVELLRELKTPTRPGSFDWSFKDDLVPQLRKWFEPALAAIKEEEEQRG